MTLVEDLGEPRSKRWRLATELLRVRAQAGVSGRELAQRIGISQSKVSRIESGMTTPTLPEVTAWAEAVGTTNETRGQLENLTEAVFAEALSWRAMLRRKPHLQDDVGRLETTAKHVRTFQPTILPGLLQTAEYASGVFSTFQVPYSTVNLAAAVAGRLNRQRVLHAGGRFDFLVTETALRWRPGSRAMLADQLDRIIALSAAKSVSIGLILLDSEAVAAIPHGFVIYDGTVSVETVHREVEVTDPADVELYRDQWSKLSSMAVFGKPLREFILSLIADLRGAS